MEQAQRDDEYLDHMARLAELADLGGGRYITETASGPSR
jgi:hypothetical protein